VAWVAERKDVLCAFFGLLTLFAYSGYARTPSAGRYLAVAVLFALSLMAKPMLVTLPCLLLVLDWWPLRRAKEPGSWRGLVKEKLPLLGLAVACCFVTFRAQAAEGAVRDWQAFPLTVRLGNAAVSYTAYLWKTVWPVNLTVYYPHPGSGLPAWRVAAAVLLLAAATAVAAALRRRAPYLLAGWLWYAGTLVPVIGLVQVGGQAYADRYTYFPQVGLLVAVSWGAADLARGRVGDALAAGAVTAVALAALTWDQQSVWHDSAALWGHAFGVTGDDPVVLVNLGQSLEESGRLEEAAIRLRSALLLDPGSFAGRINLGSTLLKQKKWDEAELQFQEACSLRPKSPWGHNWLGKLYMEQGRLAEATEQFEEACRLAPDASEGYMNLGLVQEKRGDLARAAESYWEALRLEPNSAEAHYGLGSVLLGRGDAEGGIAQLHAALRLNPRLARAHTLLGKTLAARNDLRGASDHLERVVEIHPGSPSAWYNWGVVLGQQGRFADAAKCLARALELDPGSAAIRQARDSALEAAGRGGPAPGTPSRSR
jgi:tetratricopeptide (TPR) repeat protein